MGYRLTFELLLSESCYETCKDSNINITEIMTSALFEHIKNQRNIKDYLTKVTLMSQFNELKCEMAAMEEKIRIERLKIETERNEAIKLKSKGIMNLFKLGGKKL